jgi:hypothetical protein
MLQTHGISKNVFETMLCIAAEHRDIEPLKSFLGPFEFNSNMISRYHSIWNAILESHNSETWSLLIDNGLKFR